jgi:hypothetical protein
MMGKSEILENFFEEQHRKWKKSVLQSVRKENSFNPDLSQILKQNSQRETVGSNSSHEDKNK